MFVCPDDETKETKHIAFIGSELGHDGHLQRDVPVHTGYLAFDSRFGLEKARGLLS